MILTLEEVKGFLKIDYTDEDVDLADYLANAEDYLTDCFDDYDIKILNDRFARKAKYCMKVLINEMYSNKELATDKQEKYKLLIQSNLQQMTYGTYEVLVDGQ